MNIYKIYVNDNTLFIADHIPEQNHEIEQLDVQEFDFPTFFKEAILKSGKTYLLQDSDPKQRFKMVKKSLVLIKAAGGLVRSAKGNYLFIFRNKKWDLPKGKVEKGEKIKEAGQREVEEECGVKIATNGKKLGKTYHVYAMGTRLVLKKTNWYHMTVKGEPKLIPQKEEGITKACWLAGSKLGPILENTYPAIVQVLEEGSLLSKKDHSL